MTETKLSIKVVGWYEHPRTAEPEDCQLCHNADWGDVIIEGVCGKCLTKIRIEAQQVMNTFAAKLSELIVVGNVRKPFFTQEKWCDCKAKTPENWIDITGTDGNGNWFNQCECGLNDKGHQHCYVCGGLTATW